MLGIVNIVSIKIDRFLFLRTLENSLFGDLYNASERMGT